MSTELSSMLRTARRRLTDIPEYEMITDFKWQSKVQRWALHFRLHLPGITHPAIPISQDWYALVDKAYPHGEITICPALKNGISATFPHQNFNQEVKDVPWRSGVVCVNTGTNNWGRKELTNEPADDEDKLAWHIQRLVDWLKAAAEDKLTLPGEPFELPHLPPVKKQALIVFNEGPELLPIWQQTAQMSGIAQLKPFGESRYAIENYGANQASVTYKWGKYITGKTTTPLQGVWIRFNQVPTRKPFQLPQTWAELFSVAAEQNIPFRSLLIEQLRKCKTAHPAIILLGFPIPENYGEENYSMYWMALKMPDLPIIKGFRNRDTGYDHQFKIMFPEGATLQWCNTENWHKAQISTRGKLSQQFVDARIVVIGAGAMGSSLSELLVRLGVEKMTIVDGDVVSMGNLCRHTLSMLDTKYGKAGRLAERLNGLSPHVSVNYFDQRLQDALMEHAALLSEADLVIDTTGNDQVIHLLSANRELVGKHFISLSVGLQAKRLYCYGGKLLTDEGFAEDFFTKHRSWLEKDKQQAGPITLPMEGVGCWHPVFPARYDDILVLLNAVIKDVEAIAMTDTGMRLVVAERQFDSTGNSSGVNILRNDDHEI